MKDAQKPASFDIDGSKPHETMQAPEPEETPRPKARPETFSLEDVEITPDFETTLEELPLAPAPAKPRRLNWGSIFWSAFALLVSLTVGLWVDRLIRDLFERNEWLGYLGLAVTLVFALATFVIVFREIWAIARLSRVDRLRLEAVQAYDNSGSEGALNVQDLLDKLYSDRPDMAEARARLHEHREDIIDARDRIRLIERDLLKPLDIKAEQLVSTAAKRVAIVTAVSPRALFDMLYVLFENIRLIRAIATLYSGRPGTLATVRLFRTVLSHLAVTGAIAVGDGLLQQVIGHGLAARLSARFGEGVVNGLLTARIGLAAHDICRPVPFLTTSRPKLSTYMKSLTGLGAISKNE